MKFSEIATILKGVSENNVSFWIVTKEDKALYCNYYNGELWVRDDNLASSTHVPVDELIHNIKHVLPCY